MHWLYGFVVRHEISRPPDFGHHSRISSAGGPRLKALSPPPPLQLGSVGRLGSVGGAVRACARAVEMATALARVPSGPLAWDGADIFGDDFDDVVAAVFASDGDAPAWLEAPIAPASKAPASAPPRAAPARAPAPLRADGKQAVTPLHRCVNPVHAMPCAWCVLAAPSHPTQPVAGRFRPPRAPRAHAGAPSRRAGAHPRRPLRMSWTMSWWATPARCGARSPDLGFLRVARVPLPPAPVARADGLALLLPQKNGEKKLRSQLTHTPEWNNVRGRAAAVRRNRSIRAGCCARCPHRAPRHRNPALGPAPRAPRGPWRAPDAPHSAP